MGKGELLMWTYNKVLEYPINIKNRNPQLAKFIISQYGGPDGELSASLRYLSQRFGMPDQTAKAILNDIGTEELAHLEMVGTIIHQLTDGCWTWIILYRPWLGCISSISSRNALFCLCACCKR